MAAVTMDRVGIRVAVTTAADLVAGTAVAAASAVTVAAEVAATEAGAADTDPTKW